MSFFSRENHWKFWSNWVVCSHLCFKNIPLALDSEWIGEGWKQIQENLLGNYCEEPGAKNYGGVNNIIAVDTEKALNPVTGESTNWASY